MSLSHVALMFSFNKVGYWEGSSKPASLLDNDDLGCSAVTKSQIYAEQLKDLVSLDGGLESSHIINKASKNTRLKSQLIIYIRALGRLMK